MTKKTISVKELILDSKPFTLYGGTFFIGTVAVAVSLLLQLQIPSFGVVLAVTATVFSLLVNFLLRFYISRNHNATRKRIQDAVTDEEALNVVCGGIVWGLSTLAIIALVFLISLQVFVL